MPAATATAPTIGIDEDGSLTMPVDVLFENGNTMQRHRYYVRLAAPTNGLARVQLLANDDSRTLAETTIVVDDELEHMITPLLNAVGSFVDRGAIDIPQDFNFLDVAVGGGPDDEPQL